MTSDATVTGFNTWSTNRRRLAATGVLMSVPLVVTMVWILTRGYLPEKVRDLYSWSPGTGAASVRVSDYPLYVGLQVGPCLIAALVALWTGGWSRVTVRRRKTVLVLGWFVWLQPLLFLKSMLVSYGVAAGQVAQPGLWQLAATFAVAGVSVPILSLVLPPYRDHIAHSRSSEIHFDRHEHVVWIGRAVSRGHVALFFTLLAAAVGLLFVNVPWALLPLILAVPETRRLSTRTVIDNRGVHVMRGLISWPQVTIGLDQITSASDASMRQSGFSGLRWEGRDRYSWHPRSAVIRPGPVLVLHVAGTLPLLVSLERAYEAAKVVNALLQRLEENHETDAKMTPS
jgi:hypothetical protein